ncbi:MAG: class 1 fructose-bisphosphatase [Desulfarculaceae bacterium]|nr:class 1 fructose-bisphosphatase [Desulfarculaceae bacterium]
MNSSAGVTITNHILDQQSAHAGATGAFTHLLNEIVMAAKIINSEVNKAGLVDILGSTGRRNVQGETVKKLDEFANSLMVDRLYRSGHVAMLASEEDSDPIEPPRGCTLGDYIVTFDPLDGSSNIDANVSIGTIFSILKRRSKGPECDLSDFLQPGTQQVAAGYVLYGSSTMLVYSTGNGVSGFTLDPSVGEFLLSHPDIQVPSRGKIVSANMGYWDYWSEGLKSYFRYLRTKTDDKPVYSLRYIGSMVADIHRTLLYGGVFLYPADSKDPKKPWGKLRLLYECNPMAYLMEQAGGAASTGEGRVLEVDPTDLHQRVPFIGGSAQDVAEAVAFISGQRSE